LLLTHAHIDHSGLLPKLYRHGFRGRILATTATAELCGVLLPDSAHVQQMEVERKNRKLQRAGRPLLQPIYTVEEAYQCQALFQPVEYRRVIGLTPEIKVCFYEAGHILGSASIKVWVRHGGGETSVVFSGDVGKRDQPLVNDPDPPTATDYLVLESTYGNRRHPGSAQDGFRRLASIISETRRRGGNVLIPAFAVERTQDILFALGQLIREGVLDPGEVYLDSPLAVAATEIFCRHVDWLDEETQIAAVERGGTCPFLLPGLKLARTAEESMAINQVRSGAVIIAASGMCDAGRIKHHLKHNLWRPECTVLLVGYQAEGTLGRRLKDGATSVTIHGEEIAVKARIEHMDDFSAHADQEGLVWWVKAFRRPPRTVFLTHGEHDALLALALRLRDELGMKVVVPKWLEEYALPAGEKTAPGKTLPDEVAAGEEADPTLQEIEAEFEELKKDLEAWRRREISAGRYLTVLQRLKKWRQEVSGSGT
jgi:metallo-beta-lactamase family protein